jgi:hypothetical protein
MGSPITITPDPQGQVSITPDSSHQQDVNPSTWQVLTQDTGKTSDEYLRYRGAAGIAGATIKGLNDVAQGTTGAIGGMWNTVRHPLDTIRTMANLSSQAGQIPAAIQDINQSPDPLTHYAQVAQDTASQGAGQALTALGTAGVAKTATAVAPYIGPVGKALVKGYASKLIPAEAKTAYQAVSDARNPPVYPGAPLPEAPPVYPGSPLPENPGTFPGANLPASPAQAVLQANALRTGGRAITSPSDALAQIRSRAAAPTTPEAIAADRYKTVTLGQPQSSAPVQPPFPGPQTYEVTRGVDPMTHPNSPAKWEMPQDYSSNVQQYGYHPDSGTVSVQYPKGAVYQFKATPQMYQNLKEAPSAGGYIHDVLEPAQRTGKGTYVGTIRPKVTPGQKVSQALGGQQ